MTLNDIVTAARSAEEWRRPLRFLIASVPLWGLCAAYLCGASVPWWMWTLAALHFVFG